jgi:hypothetical protein
MNVARDREMSMCLSLLALMGRKLNRQRQHWPSMSAKKAPGNAGALSLLEMIAEPQYLATSGPAAEAIVDADLPGEELRSANASSAIVERPCQCRPPRKVMNSRRRMPGFRKDLYARQS